MSVIYLVAASLDQGIRDAREHAEWTQIAFCRFVTPEKHDIRVIARASELVPFAGTTPMIKGSDYEDGPTFGLESWIKHKDEIDRFIDEGNGEWVEAP